jgi:hypothetical protein
MGRFQKNPAFVQNEASMSDSYLWFLKEGKKRWKAIGVSRCPYRKSRAVF